VPTLRRERFSDRPGRWKVNSGCDAGGPTMFCAIPLMPHSVENSGTVVASLLDWANAALKNKISREISMPSLNEKRGTQGQQILKTGTISFDGSGIDCLVRKMSGEGANLEVESQIGIPDSFDLVIDTEHSNHHCHVVWRKARRIGIAFD
jgi:hypothetical protein